MAVYTSQPGASCVVWYGGPGAWAPCHSVLVYHSMVLVHSALPGCAVAVTQSVGPFPRRQRCISLPPAQMWFVAWSLRCAGVTADIETVTDPLQVLFHDALHEDRLSCTACGLQLHLDKGLAFEDLHPSMRCSTNKPLKPVALSPTRQSHRVTNLRRHSRRPGHAGSTLTAHKARHTATAACKRSPMHTCTGHEPQPSSKRDT